MASEVKETARVERIERFVFADDGRIPNSRLPVVIYRRVLREPQGLGGRFEALFASNGWANAWQAGIFDYTHFHSNTHEVLGIAEGRVCVQLGGEGGRFVDFEEGDVAILPAGTGHRCERASEDLLVVGAYPDGRDWDVCRGTEEAKAVRARIAAVALPTRDPVAGKDGPLVEIWK